jgi:CRISPR/Cas system-associated protein endoribonuclease Cas2
LSKFFKKPFFQAEIDKLVASEELDLYSRIKEARANLEHAWQNFRFAQPEYIDIAIMEIHNAENEFDLLIRKLHLLKSNGQEQNLLLFGNNPRTQFSWLQTQASS